MAFEPEYSSTMKCGEDVEKEPSVEDFEKEKVENQLFEIKERWQTINKNLDSLLSRYSQLNFWVT